jgi:MarR family transcriptional regulator, organic hydroperoxide resistance regulator
MGSSAKSDSNDNEKRLTKNRKTPAPPRGSRQAREVPEKEEAFPPLSTSLQPFVKGGSDREFRRLIYDLHAYHALMVRNRVQLANYIGVTDPQLIIIMMIAETPDATVGNIAQQMDVTSQFVTIEVGKLIEKNIVEKRPNEADRRSVFLNLTSKGQSLLRELGPFRRRVNDTMFRSLTEERAKILKEIIGTLILDARTSLHELDAPHRRDDRAPSADSGTKSATVRTA